VETDLLARIRAELERRIAELRPLLDEYERLLAADSALDSFEAEPADGLPAPEPAPRSTAPRRRARGPRGSAARTIELASSAPEPLVQASEPTPSAPRTRRTLSSTPTLRTQPTLRTRPAPAPAVEAPPPAIPEPVADEPEFEPEPERKPATPSDVRHAIVAALEHGSHTIPELVMVTAMSTSEIRSNLSQLARQRKVARVKREGDGKSAFALPPSSEQT
jgi:hypothetical protein